MTRRAVFVVLGTAAAYFAAGRLGLLLAIPPGYATAVWPASGLALAALLIFGNAACLGVGLGSFLVNVATGWDASSGASVARSLLLSGVIGTGAVLQAVVGAGLVRRFVGEGDALVQEKKILRFIFLGGPVSCLVSATCGVGALSSFGLIRSGDLISSWWTWWVGDSIGVMVFAPLALLWRTVGRSGWRRPLFVTLPSMVTFAAVVALFVHSSREERARIAGEFEARAEKTADRLREEMSRGLDSLYAVEGFFTGSSVVDREEFARFSAPLLSRNPSLRGLAYDVVVPAENCPAFETALRGEGLSSGKVFEKDAQGRTSPAGERPEYVVITYAEPSSGARAFIGFDISLEPTRREALIRARETGRATATAPIQLLQDQDGRKGILVFLPVRGRTPYPGTEGYAVASYNLGTMLESLLGAEGRLGKVRSLLFDEAEGEGEGFLFGGAEPRPALVKEVRFSVAERPWVLRFTAPASYIGDHDSGRSWSLLAGGLLFTGTLSAFLMLLTGRTAHVEQEVARRTEVLRETQRRIESAFHEVESVNKELNDFAHIVSHDLKAPLRGIGSLAQWIKQDHGEKLGDEGRAQIDMLVGRVKRMGALIDGVLSYSRVARVREEAEDVDLNLLLSEVVDMLDVPPHITVLRDGSLPKVRGERVRLQQLFQNLLSNAIKYMDKSEGLVRVSCVEAGDKWLFRVEDNGPGIEPRHHERIFQIFQTLAPRDQVESTGVGLAVVKKIVQMGGGKVWVESNPGEGAAFCWTWPRAAAPQAVEAARP